MVGDHVSSRPALWYRYARLEITRVCPGLQAPMHYNAAVRLESHSDFRPHTELGGGHKCPLSTQSIVQKRGWGVLFKLTVCLYVATYSTLGT